MAGRLQLAATGIQDQYFTDNPQYTYFIKNFRKATHFSRQNVKIESLDEVAFGEKIRFKIPQNQGDLLSSVSFEFILEPIPLSLYSYVESIGHALLESVDLIIGGKLINRVTTDYLQIYTEQSTNQSKQYGLSQITGKTIITSPTVPYTNTYSQSVIYAPRKYCVNIPFFFENNPSLAIPICAITQQEVEIEVSLRKIEECVINSFGNNPYITPISFKPIPFKTCEDFTTSNPIYALSTIPKLDVSDLDGHITDGVAYLISSDRRTKASIVSINGFETQTFTNDVFPCTVDPLTIPRESISFWNYSTFFLYYEANHGKITTGRVNQVQEYIFSGVSSATVPKYDIFVIGNPVNTTIDVYATQILDKSISVTAGFGYSVAVSDDGKTIATTGLASNIIEVYDTPTGLRKRLLTGDVGAILKYVKVSGDGSTVMALDVTNSVIYVFGKKKILKLTTDDINSSFDITYDGTKTIVGSTPSKSVKVYDENGTLITSTTVVSPASLFVCISRDGSKIYYNDAQVIKFDSIIPYESVPIKSFIMNADMIYLSNVERQHILKRKVDLAITQIQQQNSDVICQGDTTYEMRTQFTNPVQELYFVFQSRKKQNNWVVAPCNYDNINLVKDQNLNLNFYEHFYSMDMTLDGVQMLDKDTGHYLMLKSVQSSTHHSRCQTSRRFYSYSFALDPQGMYSSGSRNFSVIKNQIFNFQLNQQTFCKRQLRIYAFSYNILRIENGVARQIFVYDNVPSVTTPNADMYVISRTDPPPSSIKYDGDPANWRYLQPSVQAKYIRGDFTIGTYDSTIDEGYVPPCECCAPIACTAPQGTIIPCIQCIGCGV